MEQTYASLLDSIRPLSLLHDSNADTPASADLIPLPSELELQSIWFNGQLGRDFITTCGKQVTIRQFGFWNRSAGPDFLHASVTINGVESSGPLEIDTQSSDWESHGHDTNPSFDDTILHVIFREPRDTHFTRTSNHKEVLKVVIPESIIQTALQAPIYSSAPAHLGRCYQPLAKTSLLRINELLEQAAKHRCQVKARRLNAIKDSHGADQALWIALAETLGYRPNKLQMTVLAQRLPIKELRKQSDLNLGAIIFGTAGFLHPDIHQKAPQDSQIWLEELWKEWWKVRDDYELTQDRAIQWTLHGNRPINHPQRRLATLTAIATHWTAFKKLSTNITALTEWLATLTEPHWDHHYTLTSKTSEKKLALIGKDRIHEFVINHLLPLLINEKKTSNTAWQTYQKIPAPAINEKVKRAHYRLFGERKDAKQFLKKAWQHQALIQIYSDFCLADTSDCNNCPFPEQLAQF